MKSNKTPNIILIVGGQWGDEGKGKVVDKYVEKDGQATEMMYRHHGGDNAGHTVKVGDEVYKLHMLPSGIVRPGMKCCVGPYVVCNLEIIGEELALADKCGSSVYLDVRAPIILPVHRLIDTGREAAKGKDAIGTTQRGIGPTYEDFISRRALTLGDLTTPDRIRKALLRGYYYDERALVARSLGQHPPSLDDTVDYCYEHGKLILPHLADTRAILHEHAATRGTPVLFEGAHGIMLDLIHGAPPYITSSFCTAGSVVASFGMMPAETVMIVKAYTTRVGGGPFPTELDDAVGEHLSSVGHEVGTTTGRRRRCGWLDLFAVAYATRMTSGTHIALTKLDVLSGLDEIKVCIGYRMPDGSRLGQFDSLYREVLETAKPIYKTFPGWKKDISGCRSLKELPSNAIDYLAYIQSFLKLPISIIGVGPDRDEVIWL